MVADFPATALTTDMRLFRFSLKPASSTSPGLLKLVLGLLLAVVLSSCAADQDLRESPTSVAAPASVVDGPYVELSQGSILTARWVVDDGGGELERRSQTLPDSGIVTIAAVGDLPAFDVPVRSQPPLAPSELRAAPDVPLFIHADSHGEYAILAELLRRHRIVNDRFEWTFGNGHLVILGDVLDRGARQTEILWLIYKLEAEAREAGGAVHFLLGNHETMVLRGDLRYLHEKYPKAAEVLGAESYLELLGPDTVLGEWLRTKPSVIRLNQLLFVHGGISLQLLESALSLKEINATIRDVLSSSDTARPNWADLLMGGAGPHWYRGYFRNDPEETESVVAAIDASRKAYDVDAIFVGHTPVPAVTELHDGRVIAVQVYPHYQQDTGAPVMEGVFFRDGHWYRAKIDGSLESIYPCGSASPLVSDACTR